MFLGMVLGMVLGIDVSKNTLDAALLSADEPNRKPRHKVFANTAAGHQQLLQWLTQNGADQVHTCLESTGTYGEAVAHALHKAGHKVSIVNPSLIRAFGQSQLSRTKTDKAGCPLGGRNSSRAFVRCTNRRFGRLPRLKSPNYKHWCGVWRLWMRCA